MCGNAQTGAAARTNLGGCHCRCHAGTQVTHPKEQPMKLSKLLLLLSAAAALAACDRPSPTVVNVPPPAGAVPGPPGPQGATGSTGSTGNTGSQGNQGNDGLKGNQGNQGTQGNTGNTGKPGEGTTVIVVPPAASAPN